MNQSETLLEIKDLCVEFKTMAGTVHAVDHLSYTLHRGEKLGIVGESGSGKSVSSLAMMQLIPNPPGKVTGGQILYNGKDLVKLSEREMQKIRGNEISMIFQEPMTSLNPVFTIGDQLDEVSLLHIPGATREIAKKRSIEMLNMVGIAMPERVYASFPHELSGGMRQRVMIAMALAGEPRLIIADEPTTALDVTIQAQILELFNDLKRRINGSILLITHDLGVIAEMADYVVVMYAGRIIEKGTATEIFNNPLHPYTKGLQKSKPTMKSNSDTLFNIPGNVPNPVNMPDYCYFKERCSECIGKCSGKYPDMVQVSPTHFVACHLYEGKEFRK